MELKDTVEMMCSDDYKQRFKAEVNQVLIRTTKLNDMIKKYENGELDFEPSCPISMLKKQAIIMTNYYNILVLRATQEGIEL